MCRVLWPAMGVAAIAGNGEETGRLARQMIALAQERNDDVDLANALTFLAISHLFAGDERGQLECTEQAVATARRTGNPSALAYAGVSGGVCLMDIDPVRALGLFDEALDAATSVGNQYAMGLAVANSAFISLATDDWHEAAVRLLRAADHAQLIGDIGSLRASCVIAVVTLLEMTRDDEAAALLSGAARPDAVAGAPIERFGEAVASVQERLGEERFTACAARGATLDDDELGEVIRREIGRLLDRDLSEP